MKVIRQLFQSFEVQNIDVRPRNSQLGVICTSHHNWDNIEVFTCIEKYNCITFYYCITVFQNARFALFQIPGFGILKEIGRCGGGGCGGGGCVSGWKVCIEMRHPDYNHRDYGIARTVGLR